MKTSFDLPAGQVTLRSATDEDAGFLCEVYGSTRAEELSIVDWTDAEKQAFLQMQFDAQTKHYREHYTGAEYLLILLDDEPVGRLYVDRWEKEIRVMDIALLPDWRGRGIGRCLMEDIIAEAAASGRTTTIHVEHNNPAMRLYERLGFQRIGDTGVYFLMECGGSQDADTAS